MSHRIYIRISIKHKEVYFYLTLILPYIYQVHKDLNLLNEIGPYLKQKGK